MALWAETMISARRLSKSLGTYVLLIALLAFITVQLACKGSSVAAQSRTVVTVHTDQPLGAIDPNIFGFFTEETLTSYEGGISSEMLFNRKFEMPEERDVHRPWMTGVAAGWEPIALDGNVTLLVDKSVYYSPSQAERITNQSTGIAGIQQRGYRVVMTQVSPKNRLDAPFRFRTGEHYKVRIAIKNQDLHGKVHVALGKSVTNNVAEETIDFKGGEDWAVYRLELVCSGEELDGRFMIYTDSPGTIWVDSASLVRADLDEGGFRKDVIAATLRLKPANIRWPGGWFVSDYHWKDGIGPVDERPAVLSRVWNTYTNNDIGVDEYLRLCELVGSEPYVVVNVGTGSAAEAAEMVEYVNGDSKTKWGRVRAQNGHPTPYHVRLWNIGNEEYLPNLGATSGSAYAKTFKAYSAVMRAVDPSIKLVAVGALEIPEAAIPQQSPVHVVLRYGFDWGKQFLPVAGKDADYYSIHYYEPGDSVHNQVSADDFNRASMVIAEDLFRKLQPIFTIMGHVGKRIPIALDEWSLKMPDKLPADDVPDIPAGLNSPEQLGLYGPVVTLLQAVGEAGVYNQMQRHPRDFGLSSLTILYAYSIGVIGIDREKVVTSPVGLMLEQYSTHDRCLSLQTEVEGPTFDAPTVGDFAGVKGANVIDTSSRVHPDGKSVDVFVINRDLSRDMEVSFQFPGKKVHGDVEVSTLASPKLSDWNTFDQPNRVKLSVFASPVGDSPVFARTFPPHSVSRVSLQLE
jgi:alpha-L-arabinofuranosidase